VTIVIERKRTWKPFGLYQSTLACTQLLPFCKPPCSAHMQGLGNILIGTEVCWLVGESLQTQLQQQITSACIIAYWSAGLATATGILSTTLYYIWQSLSCRRLINFNYPIISHVLGCHYANTVHTNQSCMCC